MSLPININELINGNVIEWERLEFKAGYNPEDILHSICAFANDINNWGGGYIILGIEENDGKPVLPPKGLRLNQIDKIQKELLNLCHKIIPNYFPVVVPEIFQQKHIIIIWVPGGYHRPYKVPVTLIKKPEMRYYIRRYSSTKKASPNEEKQLMQLAAYVPFDDRINHNANIDDLSLNAIRPFLQEIKSELFNESAKLNFVDLCKQMRIIAGPPEYLKPLNFGLLFFSDNPHKFFRGAKIEIVEYKDEIGDNFTEKIFTGPLYLQVKEALAYIKNQIIKEFVHKVDNQAEALRYYNYPYTAIEESLVNAVYHRDYSHQSTIEISIRLDRIEILSFPGPLPPIKNSDFKKERVISRDYRNRRIGDLLKELNLTEGRCTGIPKIRRALKKNGSPKPIFKTDRDRIYFLTTILIHPDFRKESHKRSVKRSQKPFQKDTGTSPQSHHNITKNQLLILDIIKENKYITIKKMESKINIAERNIKVNIKKLQEKGLLKRVGPNKGGYWEIIDKV